MIRSRAFWSPFCRTLGWTLIIGAPFVSAVAAIRSQIEVVRAHQALEAALFALQSPEPALPPAIRDGCKAEVWEPSGGSKGVVR